MTTDRKTFAQIEPLSVTREPLTNEVIRRLLDLVLASEIQPGDRLPSERQLAEMLGVGRSIVREAVKSLAVLGVVDVRQGDGTFLRGADSGVMSAAIEWGLLLGAHEALDLVEARQHLEVIVTRLAAERRSPRDLERMEMLINEMERSPENVETFTKADVDFHVSIAQATQNSTLLRIMTSIAFLLRVWIRRVMSESASYEPTVSEHRAILEAIRTGDSEKAAAAAEAHMNAARARLESGLTTDDLGEVSG